MSWKIKIASSGDLVYEVTYAFGTAACLLNRRLDLSRVPKTRCNSDARSRWGSSGGVHGFREFTVVLTADGIAAARAIGDQPEMKNEDAIIHRRKTATWWAAGSTVKFFRQGVLTCQDGKCEFVYIPL